MRMTKVLDQNGYRIAIEHDFAWDRINIWISRHHADGHFFAEYDDDGLIQWVEFDPSTTRSRNESTISIPRELKDLFLTAVCAYADEEGFKPTRQEKLEGTLDAQSRHLEDMRALVAKLAKVELCSI